MKSTSPWSPVLIAAAVVLLDQLTKWWVLATFELYESVEVITGFFDLTFVVNTGAAFGMLAGEQNPWRQLFFVVVTLVALVVLATAFRQYRREGRVYIAAIGLVGGGALGNLIDRLRFGHVVDFLDFYIKDYHWPAFNVADSAISIGVVLFLFAGLMESGKRDQPPAMPDGG
ncbi:MAG: signal peptidase II [Desulfobulbaceae bacterium]|nr:signal peptidase II [Desulfobulbaceae bacterium]